VTPGLSAIPEIRIRSLNAAPVRAGGGFVLYWMTACRRLGWNFALERAAGEARRLAKPLVILEPLRCGYPWASDRIHRFVLDGMAEHAARLAKSAVLYHPYVEPEAGAGKGLLAAFAAHAALVVTDDFPAFFLPRMLAAAGLQVPVRLEAVDSNGLLPLRAAGKDFVTAAHFRRFLQKVLPEHLGHFPAEGPLHELPPRLARLPAGIAARWPAADPALLAGGSLAALPIDHSVPPVAGARGGAAAGERTLARFLDQRLERYGEGRNDPGEEITSGLSPHLHFGTVSAHQMLAAVAARERWTPERLAAKATGARERWWGMGRRPRSSSTRRSPGARWDTTWRRTARTSSITSRCRRGRRRPSPGTRAALAPSSTRAPSSRPAPLTTSCGTPPRDNCGTRGASTTTCGCSGGRSYVARHGRARSESPSGQLSLV
jgi:deoxyribodipyrimidine photo-lyase